MGEDHYQLYPKEKTKWDLFKQYILPWLILLGICFGLYLALLYGLEAIIILSEPLGERMKEAGL